MFLHLRSSRSPDAVVEIKEEKSEFELKQDDFFVIIRFKDKSSFTTSEPTKREILKVIYDRDEALVQFRLACADSYYWKQWDNWGKQYFCLRKYNKSMEKLEGYTFDTVKELILKDGKPQYTKKEIEEIIKEQ
jgi:hypothetical protein